ncbi:hypothetical protein DRW07_09955 [Alteromonas sediminis]|uniref:WD40 repeat domain-containing protein n=1 Tax=Alteromonas sediminis TaxID=2259342 RepID=A0A3N5Y715_9ALTE|nr:hypothetical protein [Alteromonas sediminis]RPJ66409.1 hypothetical protein DRW07_09955 [Alteromonas sediminis]
MSLNRFIFKVSIIFMVSALAACASKAEQGKGYTVTKQSVLSDRLGETSGLYCTETGFLTLNDSGNAPVVYEINHNGEIVAEPYVLTKNVDWEAITADRTHVFVGDFGNNAGKREDLVIYKLDQEGNADIIGITYEGYNPSTNAYYGHDFDAEALVAKGEHLILFSKSWNTQVLRVYKIDKDLAEQKLSPISLIKGLPGVVTGADWDDSQGHYVLTGYSVSTIGLMKPFIAILGEDFALQRIEKLSGLNQVEGVCAKDGHIWLTQEAGKFSTAKLVNLKLND